MRFNKEFKVGIFRDERVFENLIKRNLESGI